MKFGFPLLFLVASFVLGAGQASAQVVWTFGFEDADYTAAGGNAIVFDQTFDGVANAASLIDNSYISATTNDFLYGGDYQVATGFDAQDGTNFGLLSTANTCFGFDGSAIGLSAGQEYQISFYIAALDPNIAATNFSVSAAFEASDGTVGQFQGTDEQGLDFFNANFSAPNTFTDPGFAPAATTTNDTSDIDWVLYTTTFTYDPSVTQLYVSGFGDDGVGSNMALDNIAIEAVPEPSSAILCLLGAGAWVFFGRRRRQTA